MLRSIRQLQQFLLHRPKCNWRASSEEPGGKDLVSIPGQFPGITGRSSMGQVKDSLRVMLLAAGFAQNTSVITVWSWASHAQTLSSPWQGLERAWNY